MLGYEFLYSDVVTVKVKIHLDSKCLVAQTSKQGRNLNQCCLAGPG